MKILRKIALRDIGIVVVLSLFVLPLAASAATLTRQLQIGMSGNDVSDLQTFLAADPSIYPQGLVTGYFGPLTEAAVTSFQIRNGIPGVGRVGPITMAAINARMGGAVGTDMRAPLIQNANVSTMNSSTTISWTTNEQAAGLVYYSPTPLTLVEAGPGTAITVSGATAIADLGLDYNHTATLPNLTANTTYYYVLYSRDAAGNVTVTWPSTFQAR